MGETEKKYVTTATDLLFFTDTSEDGKELDYPIYITPDAEVWLKKRPQEVSAVFHVATKDIENKYFKDEDGAREIVAKYNLQNDEIFTAIKAVLELRNASYKIQVIKLTYDVYAGDFERSLGSADCSVVKVKSIGDFRCLEKQAWAISFEWEKRIKAKYPQIAKYTYAKAIIERRNHPRVIIKIPIVSEEFEKLFNTALSATVTQTQVTTTEIELEEQIRQMQKLVEERERELQTLKEQLSQLLLKYQLEKMKKEVTG